MLDSNKVKEILTVDNVIKLCCALQESDTYLTDSYGNPIFNTCLDHSDGNSFKLYYQIESKLFKCFTTGDRYDIFELVRRAKGLETFRQAYNYVVNFFNLEDFFIDNEEETELSGDWDIFQKVKDYSKEVSVEPEVIKPIQENLLEYFYPLAAPTEWLKEGISAEVMRYFNIRVDSALHKIIIPHRDINGNLIGIRGRTYDPKELEEGKKYMPVFIEKEIYNHPLGKNLFGLYENKETIQKIGKVCIFEAEKSVLQIGTMYGVENNWSVAVCGSSISQAQIMLILSLNVEQVIIAFDADHLGKKGEPDTIAYEQKLLKIAAPLLPYVNVSVIFDYDHILPHKASPSDCGKEKFEELYHKRIRLYSYSNKDIKHKKK